MRVTHLLVSFLVVAAMAVSAQGQQFDQCGTLIRHPTCLTLQADSGLVWFLGGAGAQQNGARVRVRGYIQSGCVSGCPSSQGCVLDVQITPCETVTCRADFDRSGNLSVQDLFDFLAAYFVGLVGPSPPGGDFDQSGTVSVQDIFEFLTAWFSNCT